MDKTKKLNIYRLMQTISIVGVFVAVAILVFGITDVIKMSSGLFVVIGIIGIVCASCLLCAPWARRIQKNEFKVLSYVFISLIAVCCILWIICIFDIQYIYKVSKDATINGSTIDSENLFGVLQFLKISAIISIQFATASTIASTFVKYQKSYIPVQCIMYASHLYVDFFVTFFICCLTISNNAFEINDNISFLGHKAVYVIFILALLYVMISSAVVKRIESKKVAQIAEDHDKTINQQTTSQTAEEKLAKLKEMYDKQLITDEEYQTKKAEIIKEL